MTSAAIQKAEDYFSQGLSLLEKIPAAPGEFGPNKAKTGYVISAWTSAIELLQPVASGTGSDATSASAAMAQVYANMAVWSADLGHARQFANLSIDAGQDAYDGLDSKSKALVLFLRMRMEPIAATTGNGVNPTWGTAACAYLDIDCGQGVVNAGSGVWWLAGLVAAWKLFA